MGMFDNLRCRYPLPEEGANERLYQTKDTPAQYLDSYEIREDGSLWHEDYDIKIDTSGGFGGCLKQLNKRWVQVYFTGEIRFYTFYDERTSKGWIEWSALYDEGELLRMKLLKNSPDGSAFSTTEIETE